MKNFFPKLIAFILSFTILQSVVAQYNHAIGIRSGTTPGITYKTSTGNNAFEMIFALPHHGLSLTGLWEKHPSVAGAQGLHWIYGVGGHVILYSDDLLYGHHFKHNHKHEHNHDGDVGLGVDGILGLEYKFPPIPFALSLDIKPFIEFNSQGYYWTSIDPGLGIKYVF